MASCTGVAEYWESNAKLPMAPAYIEKKLFTDPVVKGNPDHMMVNLTAHWIYLFIMTRSLAIRKRSIRHAP